MKTSLKRDVLVSKQIRAGSIDGGCLTVTLCVCDLFHQGESIIPP
jgi:hypothetical protein